MFCVTTDNASSSNVAFIDYLLLMTFNEENSLLIEFWIHCLGSIVNTAVQDSLATMKPCFQKVICSFKIAVWEHELMFFLFIYYSFAG